MFCHKTARHVCQLATFSSFSSHPPLPDIKRPHLVTGSLFLPVYTLITSSSHWTANMRTGTCASTARVHPTTQRAAHCTNAISRLRAVLRPAKGSTRRAAFTASASPPQLALPPPLSQYGPAVNNITSAWSHAEVDSKSQSTSLLPPNMPPPSAPALHEVGHRSGPPRAERHRCGLQLCRRADPQGALQGAKYTFRS